MAALASRPVRALLLAALSAVAISLAGCGGSSCCLAPVSIPANIRGWWDSSLDTPRGRDVIYTHISREGGFIQYDYDGDAVNRGLDCFTVQTGRLLPAEQNTWLVQPDTASAPVFFLRLAPASDGHGMRVEFLDGRSRQRVLRTQQWRRLRDTRVVENEPACTQ